MSTAKSITADADTTAKRAKRAPRRSTQPKSTMDDVLAVVSRYDSDYQDVLTRLAAEGVYQMPQDWGDSFRAAREYLYHIRERLSMYASHHSGVELRVMDGLDLEDIAITRSRYIAVFCHPGEQHHGHGTSFAVLDARRRDCGPRLLIDAEDFYACHDPMAILCALLDILNACPAALRKMGVTGEPDVHDEELATFLWDRRSY